MENRLKERLTGAAILVALIVLIVPEIFRGQPTQAAPPHTSQVPAGVPVRSYTIDLNATGAPVAPSPLAGVAAAPLPGPTVRRPIRSPVRPPAPAAAAAAPAAAAAHRPSAAPVAMRAPTQRLAGVRERSAHPAADTGPVHATGGSASGWSVQLGLFSKAENATRLAHTAHAKGFAVQVSRSPRGLYRVALVGLSDRAAALRASHRLKAAGLPFAIMRPR